MQKKKYGVLLWFLLMVLFPVRVDASHHGLTVDQQKEKLESYTTRDRLDGKIYSYFGV